MVYILRIARLFLFLLLSVSGVANAGFPPQNQTQYQGTLTGVWYSSLGSAAEGSVGKIGSYAGCTGYSMYRHSVVGIQPPNGFTFVYAYCGSGTVLGGPASSSVPTRVVQECSEGSSPSQTDASICECNTGFNEVPGGGACTPGIPPEPFDHKKACDDFLRLENSTLSTIQKDVSLVGNISDGPYCYDPQWPGQENKGCTIQFQAIAKFKNPDGSYTTEGSWSFHPDEATDNSCSPTDGESLVVPPDNPCPNGFSGEMNGETKCIDRVSGGEKESGIKTESTETNDGTTTKKEETTTKTVCNDGNCETTTTTTTTTTDNATGEQTSGTVVTVVGRGEDEYCSENPAQAICDGEGGGSGSGSGTGAIGGAGGLPVLPTSFYEKKYQNGLKGVWEDAKGDLQDGKIGQLKSALIPSLSDRQGCPRFAFFLDVGIANFGEVDVSPPCEVWVFLRVITIVSALFLARALIFGG